MCGIAGLVYADRDRPCEAETVIAMRDIMPRMCGAGNQIARGLAPRVCAGGRL